MKPLKGIHHVSAITADAEENYHFYTQILGMRLVKKTVNQDETSMYHLFYADERGTPGTDLTFFEISNAGRTYKGTRAITNTSLRVKDNNAIDYWKNRLADFDVSSEEFIQFNNRKALRFTDFEGQRLTLVSDETNEGVPSGKPWKKSPVPVDKGITGLGPAELTVSKSEKTITTLTKIMGFQITGNYKYNGKNITVLSTGEGGTGAEVHVIEERELPSERPGRGSVHHVAFRVESEEELHKWIEYINSKGISNSGFVERYYFKSLYFREPNGILFELATEGPGFESDEPFDRLGEKLALPPYLEHKRAEIEAKVKPLRTIR